MIPRLLELVAGLLLGAWFAASVAANVTPRRGPIRRARLAWLLPEWRFFAPTPAGHDYVIFMRWRRRDGAPSRTRTLCWPERSRFLYPVANPYSRIRKVVRDSVDALLVVATLDEPVGEDLVSSPGYVTLLQQVLAAEPRPPDEYVQFGVLIVEGELPPRVAFVSRWHPCVSADSV